ncbi:MAG: S8 family serine peptidase [Candidatus Cloacimonetes bacterium]|nr:S8 family serine peptidase [Candidatus Cloacimonadota bacterium]
MRRCSIIFMLLLLGMLYSRNRTDNDTTSMDHYPDRIKIKLTSNTPHLHQFPRDISRSFTSFMVAELDSLFLACQGNRIMRAHRQVSDANWEAQTGFDRWFILYFPVGIDLEKVVMLFRQCQYVEFARLEYYVYPTVVPNDEYYSFNWGHNNTAQLPGDCTPDGDHAGNGVGTPGFDTKAELAWEDIQGYGIPEIVVAILDSGADFGHPDVNWISGWDYGDLDSDPSYVPGLTVNQGHGVATASIAAGKANNTIGVIGVAGACSVMPIKIMDSWGQFSHTSIANSITHAADHGANIVSMSFGSFISPEMVPDMELAISYAYNLGVILFGSSGNDNMSQIIYPASHANVIAVGAASPCGQRKSPTTCDGDIRWGSNYGANIPDAANAVDILCPTILPVADIRGPGGYTPGDYYMWFAGTSCSTPYAAGVAALLLSKNSSLTPAEVKFALTSTATDMTIDGGVGWDRYTGYGLINAYAALSSIPGGFPYLSVDQPAGYHFYELGEVVSFLVTAFDLDGTISQVQFYVNDELDPRSIDIVAPYTWNWDSSDALPGINQIRVIAIDDDNNSVQKLVPISIKAPADEGFESGNLLAHHWQNTSAVPWGISGQNPFSGSYSARSGTIGHGSSTSLSITLNVLEAAFINFAVKVSSQINADYLRFYINNVLQEAWSGECAWAFYRFAVEPGQNDFRWTYSKSPSIQSGEDRAMLDHITFPPHIPDLAPPRNFIATGAVNLVQLSWLTPEWGLPDEYEIWRNGSLYSRVAGTSFTDANVSAGATYRYQLRVVYPDGLSGFSPECLAMPLFAGPHITLDNEFLGASLISGEQSTDGFCISNIGSQTLAYNITLQELRRVSQEPNPASLLRNPLWLEITPLSGNLPSLGFQHVSASFSSQDLAPGMYQALLLISSNDPENTMLEVMAMLEIVSGMLCAPQLQIENTPSGTIRLSWQAIDNALSYQILGSETPQGPYQMLANTHELFWEENLGTSRRFYRVIASTEP